MICSDVVAIHVDRHNDRNARESNLTIVCVTVQSLGAAVDLFLANASAAYILYCYSYKAVRYQLPADLTFHMTFWPSLFEIIMKH